MTLKDILLIAFSILIATWLAIMPLPAWAIWWRPAWITLVLIYWLIMLPDKFGLATCFLVGIILDIMDGTLLGEHALALIIVGFIVLKQHRQMRVYPFWQQLFYIAGLVFLHQLILFLIQGINGDIIQAWEYWLVPITSVIIWPWIYHILAALQRRFMKYYS